MQSILKFCIINNVRVKKNNNNPCKEGNKMYNKNKTDYELGREVHAHLVEIGIETPIIDNELSRNDKITAIESKFKDILETLGLDLTDDSLMETPKRVAKMYVNEIFYGLDWEAFPKATVIENKMQYDEMVIERNINVQSTCEHHFVNISGKAHVAYIPKNKVLGLSKLNRVVEYFAKRPQVQERLTEQVFYALAFILETEDVAVVIDADHFCVKSRGIEDVGSSTVTSKLGGKFRDDLKPQVRQEFMSLVNSALTR